MKIDVLTLFPEMFSGVFNDSILKRAQERGAVELNTVNFRDFSVWWGSGNVTSSTTNF